MPTMYSRHADGTQYTDEGIDEAQEVRKLQETTCLYENTPNTTSDNFIHTWIHTFY